MTAVVPISWVLREGGLKGEEVCGFFCRLSGRFCLDFFLSLSSRFLLWIWLQFGGIGTLCEIAPHSFAKGRSSLPARISIFEQKVRLGDADIAR